MTRQGIIAALIKMARAIGRWILEFAAKHGGAALAGYMLGKVGDFKRRRARARTDRRRAWLDGRIRRWTAALAWLKQHGSKVAADMIDDADKLVGQIPVVADAEREQA
jgi:hypothetical protein